MNIKDIDYNTWRKFPPMKKEDYARMAFEYIKDLEAENKALKAGTEEDKPMNIKKTIEKIESGSCRNVTHAEMRQLVSHIKDLTVKNLKLTSGNIHLYNRVQNLETNNETLKERINELETSLLEARDI